MPSVPEAIDILRATLCKQGIESHVQDAFDNAASCLVLLNSSSPSIQMIRKLCTVLRQPLLPLYNACLQPALQLSSAVLSTVLGKLCDAQDSENETLRAAWDATAEVILSGILDFLDQTDGKVESDGVAWEVLCRIICEFFLDSGRGLPIFSIPLCLSAYNTLTETAVRQITIQNALRHRAGLGGERLGAAISRTRDYLPLEALLTLFARLLPPIHNTSLGKLKRIEFVKEVLGSPKLFKCSEELLDIMQNTSGTQWDDVAARIIDALARSDITYPQPFSIDEIDVCGQVFPQPLATDRLILDKQSFLVNVVVENNDVCESLQVPYSHIRTVALDNSEQNVPKGKVLIMVYLMSPPLVANVEMKPLDGSDLHAKFLLQDKAVGRFMEALRRRGVGKLSFLNPLTRVQEQRKSISIGSGFKFTNDSSPMPPTATFEGKVQHVNQVYKTDVEDLATSETVTVSHVRDTRSWSMLDPNPGFRGQDQVPEVHRSDMAGDVSSNLKNAKSTFPSETSKFIHNSTLPLPPARGNSTRAIQLPSDSDELSDISEFEPENESINERTTTGVSTTRNHKLQQTRRKIDHTLMTESSSVMRIKKSSGSKNGDRTTGVAQRISQTGKPLLTSASPILGSSSSTQIDVSPKSLSNVDALVTTIDTEVAQGRYISLHNIVGIDEQKKTSVDGCGLSDAEPRVTSAPAENHPAGFSSAANECRRRARRRVPPSGANQKVHSRVEVIKDTNVLPKIAGSRRKRETIKSSSKVINEEIDDEHTPPRKKSRGERKDHRVNADDTLPTPGATRYAKMAKFSSPGVDLTTIDFDKLPEFKSPCQGARRSSRIKERQTAGTGGKARVNVVHGRKGKEASTQTIRGIEHEISAADSLQDTGVRIRHGTSSTPSSQSIPTLCRVSPFADTNGRVPLMEPRISEEISPKPMPKASTVLPCEPTQLNSTPTKESWGDLDSVQQAPLEEMQPIEEHLYLKTEENTNDKSLQSDLRHGTVDNNGSLAREVVGYVVSLKESKEVVEPSRPLMESTPRKIVTIDLTIDDSPAQEKDELYEASVGPARSATVQTEHKHRSVTFASPIEYVPNKTVRSKTQVSSSSRQSLPPPEKNFLSPLRTLTESKGNHHPYTAAVTRPTVHVKASVHSPIQVADEDGIPDIVDILDEIHTVIIKGVSGRFRNIKKDIQHGRDELIQHVLDELQGMVVENAKYFNGLVRLEEDYYRNGRAITRCWEELIDCNDGIAVQFQNALREHDQSIPTRTFPKSLLPLQPVFVRRRANA